MPRSRAHLNGYDSISATKLLATQLPDLEYLVEGILPEGLGILAGAPKTGKSWLALQTAIEISQGGELLGRRCHEPRPALYYGLEDGPRRLQKRLRTLGRDRELTGLRIRLSAPRLHGGLEDDVEKWLTQHEGGVVFIDVLSKVRPKGRQRGRNAYDEDYEALGAIHDVAQAHPGSAVVVLTHDRKAESEDYLVSVTGTRGVTGSADWVWVLKRRQLDPRGSIYVTGRDIEREMLLGASFNGAWSLDDRPLPTASNERNQIYEWLEEHGPAFAKSVAEALNMNSRQAAQYLLNKMHESGQVQKTDKGYDIDRDMATARKLAANLREDSK